MDSKQKFSNKVSDYVKYRPTYPSEFIQYIVNEIGLANRTVADIGAGTGILTKQLANKVRKIYAVEPNRNMRFACCESCNMFDAFVSVDGSAEETNLNDNSIDFITTAQAFHWFDRNKAKTEFKRILKPDGKVILVWNSRVADNIFVKENDELCRRLCPEFKGFSGGRGTDPELYSDFFRNGVCEYKVFENDRVLTLDAYIGSSLSGSYAPAESDENYKEFINGLKDLFNKYSIDGTIIMPNKTHSYVGRV